MSFFDKIKRIFTKSSSDDLFVPVEYKIRPHKENVTELSDNNEWIKEYLPEAYKQVIYKHHKNLCIDDYLIDDKTKNEVLDTKTQQTNNAPNYKTTYRINIDTNMQDKIFYKYIIYVTSVDVNNNNKEYTSYCIIQGDQIHSVSKSIQLFTLEREIYSLCNKHSKLIGFELSSDFKLQLINELRKNILV